MNHRLLLPLIPALATLAFAGPAMAAAPEAASENWAGYEATSTNASGFSAVSGGWVQPTATCTNGETGYGAFWVGLGGASGGSQALEQVGTQSDCTAAGKAVYYAWYELVPKAPVRLDLTISAGDRIYARTAVSGDSVTVTLSDQTTGQSATKTLTMANPAPDTSTAEWIAEAPSACANGNTEQCQPLPLTDFGTVKFDSAYATSAGHTGAAGTWNPQEIALSSGSGTGYGYGYMGYEGASNSGSAGAQPSSLSSDGSEFTVSYSANDTSTATSGYSGDGYGNSYGYSPGYGYAYGGGGYAQSYGYGGGWPGAYLYAY